MSIKKRLSQAESQSAALEAARSLLIQLGPQAVTLKAVAARVGRTHANLLHHFGSAGGLQKALAQYLADRICTTIADAVIASRAGVGSPRAVVDLTFDAFDKEGAGALASWMLLSGNRDALDPIIDAIHDVVEELHEYGAAPMREMTLTLVLMALGDAQLGQLLSASLSLPRQTARDMAERLLIASAESKLLHQPA
jgi:AcrR family transcriptional regulator